MTMLPAITGSRERTAIDHCISELRIADAEMAGAVERMSTALRTLRDSLSDATPPQPIAEKFISRAHAAQILNVDVTTVGRWIDAGMIPMHRLPSGHGSRPMIRFRESELFDWLAAEAQRRNARSAL
ncbi:MAG: helix-turn-helix domain-containing protein [Candidatus Dormibacteria bacterium]